MIYWKDNYCKITCSKFSNGSKQVLNINKIDQIKETFIQPLSIKETLDESEISKEEYNIHSFVNVRDGNLALHLK